MYFNNKKQGESESRKELELDKEIDKSIEVSVYKECHQMDLERIKKLEEMSQKLYVENKYLKSQLKQISKSNNKLAEKENENKKLKQMFKKLFAENQALKLQFRQLSELKNELAKKKDKLWSKLHVYNAFFKPRANLEQLEVKHDIELYIPNTSQNINTEAHVDK